jgi:prevent-host-death family protein
VVDMLGGVIGIRDLRADLPALVRRAAAGERVVITTSGQPTAVLAPLTDSPAITIDHLVATARLQAPIRTDRRLPDAAIVVPATVRFDRILREIRG